MVAEGCAQIAPRLAGEIGDTISNGEQANAVKQKTIDEKGAGFVS